MGCVGMRPVQVSAQELYLEESEGTPAHVLDLGLYRQRQVLLLLEASDSAPACRLVMLPTQDVASLQPDAPPAGAAVRAVPCTAPFECAHRIT